MHRNPNIPLSVSILLMFVVELMNIVRFEWLELTDAVRGNS
jgi:hypothetical protein